ncbi:ATP-binding cassette domain-containing protein [Streptomyces sp. A5-4]|uniref:ATP-binding cassette domain-containing protein n=1 Tax=Streptomyces sp. A5-4 TaxID=3384771 RepID=UPI003DA81AB9
MKLVGVGRRYGLGGPWVLRGVDLDLPARGLVRIEGANGSGKSTLLRLLAGIDAPMAGRVLERPRTAYVPERFPAALPFTAAGYLTHLGRIHGLGRNAARERAGEWLERFGAAGHARTPLAELSKGTSQKVAVAQALLGEPELLVLDEAWTGLDVLARDAFDRAVAERVAGGATVVFVDHDLRRLVGAVDQVHRVEGGALMPITASAEAVATGPPVRIDAVAPGGAALPPGLPGAPVPEPGPEGAVRLTVSAAYSDGVLRALLTARPPWHVRAVLAADQGPPAADRAPGRAVAGADGERA